MTQLFKRLSIAFLTTAFMATLVYVPTSRAEGTGQYMEDSVITTKVKVAIAKDLDRKVTDIKVETNKGRVQLSGFVKSQAEIDRAVQIANGVEGVTSVQNDLHLK